MSQSAKSDQDNAPRAWYRQFWPWFVFALPGLAVAAGIATVILAVSNPDEVLEQDQGMSSTDLGSATSAVTTASFPDSLI